MSIVEFLFLDKRKTDLFLPDLFKILHSNMSLIAPTENSYDEDFRIWSSNIIPAMEAEQRQIILMYVNNTLEGYFQYYIDADRDLLMIEELQITEKLQGTLLLFKFCRWLAKLLPENILYVAAYANKKNYRSQSILKYLGLVESGENKNGNSYYYKGNYDRLLGKYVGRRS